MRFKKIIDTIELKNNSPLGYYYKGIRMHSRQARFFICALFITFATNNHLALSPEDNWRTYGAKETIIASTIGTATTLLIGKKLYDLYLTYFWSNKNVMQHCNALYKKIYTTIQNNKNTYQNNSQLSDWNLKEIIYAQKNNSPYPFMAYHSSLTQSLYTIKKQLRTLQKELNYLHKRKQQLVAYKIQKYSYMIKMLTRLEIKGHMLEAHLYKIQSMIIILKNRIALFKEYNNDYQNWLYEKNKKQQEKNQNH
jgi:hypothetical protein